MAERRGWTTAKRRRRPRWPDLRFGRAPGYYGGPSALANAWRGGLWRRGHDDGAHGGTPARRCAGLELTELKTAGTGWRRESRGRRLCGCGDGEAARRGLCRQRLRWRCGSSTAMLAGAADGEGDRGEVKKGAWLSAGGRWRDEGALGRGVACAVRATATRGRRNLHAAALL